MFFSTKTYCHNVGLSAAFRQWRAESHCRFLHGYSLEIRVVFGAHELDERNWVVDFGGLKDFKHALEQTFDHKTVVAEDDPQLEWFREGERRGLLQLIVLPHVGCEKFAEYTFGAFQALLENHGFAPRCYVHSVEVREHGGNSAIFVRS